MDGSPLRRVLRYLWRQSLPVGMAVAAAVFMSLSVALVLMTVGLLVHVIVPTAGELPPFLGAWHGLLRHIGFVSPNQTGGLVGVLVVTAALVLLAGVLRYLGDWAGAVAVARASGALRRAVYLQAYKLGNRTHRDIGAADAIERFTRDVGEIEQAMRVLLSDLVRLPLAAAFALAVGFAVQPLLTLLSLALAALAWVLVWTFRAQFTRRRAEAMAKSANQLAVLQESMFGMRIVKSLGMEHFEHARFFQHMDRYERDTIRADRVVAMERPFAIFWGVVGVGLYLGLAGYNIVEGHLSLPAFATVSGVVISLYWPVSRLLSARRGRLPVARSAARGLCRYLDLQPKAVQVAGAMPMGPVAETLRLENVALELREGEPILTDVSFELPAGSRTAVVGLSTLEKRCLADLILRLVDPTGGKILADGQDVHGVALDHFRDQVALVTQENLLFNDTVRNNLGCGDPRFDLQDLAEAAKAVHAHHFIQSLPRGYETLVGDQGVALSLGERHRLALARAYVRNPSLVVIEEPTGKFDEQSEAMIEDAMARFVRGRTIVTVAHRLDTIRNADQILVLHHGRVEAMGTHKELTAASGLYRHLQYTEFNIFAEPNAGP